MNLIYRSCRLGQNGKIFPLLKFRTLCLNADKIGGSSTADDDPRITRIGRFLRKTKLDELPQVVNILRGEMTLIGWRPEVPQYLDTIPKEVLATKPGIIGWATLSDMDEGAVLKGSKNPDKDYEEKIMPKKRELELWYVRNKSIWLDLKIICLTIYRIFVKK